MDQTVPTTQAFEIAKYMNIETYRRSEEAIRTPVWFVESGGLLFFLTRLDSGKVKRLRHNAEEDGLLSAARRYERRYVLLVASRERTCLRFLFGGQVFIGEGLMPCWGCGDYFMSYMPAQFDFGPKYFPTPAYPLI